MRAVTRWLEERTGAGAAVRNFLREEIPGSAGWPQAFGSVALFLFLTQAFTGVLLTLNYAPAPTEAYNSLQFIMREVAGGRLIRGLHHWGASMMVVVVVLHMIQVFLYGAYKRPREVTWMVGVVLLLITLGFGLTGYLLPWDNRAYWGTVVTAQIAAQTPVLGRYLQRLMGVETGVGAVALIRFHTLHTIILPGLALLMVTTHLLLIRKHGITPSAVERRPARTFHPEQAFKDAVAVFAAFVVLFVLAAAVKAPLERPADPTDSAYVPRPEWYFLFLFQALKAFTGPLEPLGSVLLPAAAVGLLFAVPFVDRSRMQRVAERTAAMAAVALATLAWASLTAAAVLTTPTPGGAPAGRRPNTSWRESAPEQLAGLGYFHRARCSSCHNLAAGPPRPGPNLAGLASARPAEVLIAHFQQPGAAGNGDFLRPTGLAPDQLETLAAFVQGLTSETAAALSEAPPEITAGAQIFVANGCGGCHKVNGSGGTLGPSLNGVGGRRSRDWIAQRLRDPRLQSPGTVMPAFGFSAHDRDLLISYLLSLPKE